MTEARPARTSGGVSRDDEGATAALGLAELLCLGATPTFAILALLTAWAGARRTCSARRRKMHRR
jgi:hypothetical protein